jgi:hypothetical protein
VPVARHPVHRAQQDRGKVSVAFRGEKDAGYASTSKMITECAICLLLQDASNVAGIWTPGATMGEKLISRLVRNAGSPYKSRAKTERIAGERAPNRRRIFDPTLQIALRVSSFDLRSIVVGVLPVAFIKSNTFIGM